MLHRSPRPGCRWASSDGGCALGGIPRTSCGHRAPSPATDYMASCWGGERHIGRDVAGRIAATGAKVVVVEERTGLTCRPAPYALRADEEEEEEDDDNDDDDNDVGGPEGGIGPSPIEETAAEGVGTWPAVSDDVG